MSRSFFTSREPTPPSGTQPEPQETPPDPAPAGNPALPKVPDVNLLQTAVAAYRAQGYVPIPVDPRSKKPSGGDGWNERTYTLEDFPRDGNVGLLLGTPGGGLVDFDFDWPEAAQIASVLLSNLPAFGRTSSPGAHRLIRCPDPQGKKVVTLDKQEKEALGLPPSQKGTIIEVRGTGQQTVVPPSIHETGEQIAWEKEGQPPEMKWDDAVRISRLIAFLSIVLRKYPRGQSNRDEICMALAGALLSSNKTPKVVDDLIELVAKLADDEEASSRRKAKATAAKMAAGEKASGLPKLCELLGMKALESKLRGLLSGSAITSSLSQPVEGIQGAGAPTPQGVEDGPIARVNARYFAALDGRKVQFFREDPDRLVTLDKEAFAFELASDRVKIGDRDVSVSKIWTVSPKRRYYPRGFVLDPTCKEQPGTYNLWKGFGVEPFYDSEEGEYSWRRIALHVIYVLAAGNFEHAAYIFRWTAWSLQHPATPPGVALVFRGDEGTGKGAYCKALVKAFGVHGQRLQSESQVTGRFNGHFRHCCLLFADEAALLTKENEGTLKGMITEPTLPIEDKFQSIVHVDNHLHVVMASNNDWVVPAGIGARRFAIFDVDPSRKGDSEYFDDLFDEIEGGGLAAMMGDFLHWNLDKWHPESARPDTHALAEQKAIGLRGVERAIFNYLTSGTLPCGEAKESGCVRLPTSEFSNAIKEELRRDVSPNALQGLFGKLGFARAAGRPRGWEIPPLAEARRAWDERVMAWGAWEDGEEWEVSRRSVFGTSTTVIEKR